jgi:hypothetical protein
VEQNETSFPEKNRIKEREREMTLPYLMSLHRGLLWLNVNLALLIQRLSQNNIFFNFTDLVGYFHVLQRYAFPRLKTTAVVNYRV